MAIAMMTAAVATRMQNSFPSACGGGGGVWLVDRVCGVGEVVTVADQAPGGTKSWELTYLLQ